MSAYTELLQDPQWQKKRLEIMNRDKWMCQQCRDSENMLTVHQKYYDKSIMPWEYPNYAYVTLCKDCHDRTHRDQKQITKEIIDHFKHSDYLLCEAWEIAEIFRGLQIQGDKERFLGGYIRVFI